MYAPKLCNPIAGSILNDCPPPLEVPSNIDARAFPEKLDPLLLAMQGPPFGSGSQDVKAVPKLKAGEPVSTPLGWSVLLIRISSKFPPNLRVCFESCLV